MSEPRSPFFKAMGDFDRIELKAGGYDDWLTLTMKVGANVEEVSMTFRSDEAVRDLHYAVGRYLAHIDPAKA